MKIDNDIEQLLTNISKERHTVNYAIEKYLESLPGYQNSHHSPLTVRKYRDCLIKNPNNFTSFLKKNDIEFIEDCKVDILEFYKSYVMNRVDLPTARSHITAVRQLFKFVHKLGWIQTDISKDYRLPKRTGPHIIRTVPTEVLKLLFASDWGRNPFVISRNRLICHLYGSRGLRPLELPRLYTTSIHPYKDLGFQHIHSRVLNHLYVQNLLIRLFFHQDLRCI